MIKQQDINKVLDAANIVDVVSDFVQLTPKGKVLKGLCPFHEDSNPSLTVTPAMNIFKCFACGEGGGPIKFVEKHENYSFPEAVKYLAKKYGIIIDEKAPTAEEEAQYKHMESLWLANERLCEVYQKQLEKNKAAQEHSWGRWGEEFCKTMGIGFCPKFAHLVDSALIPEDIVKELNLKNSAGYDFFSGRIIIPIRDKQHHIIGFTARDLDREKKEHKYLNSQDSVIYKKSKSVLGIDTAWKEARTTKTFYVVEGAPDVLRLQSIGVYNTVAPLGTALTDENLTLLKKVASHLCFLPDSDPPKDNQKFGAGINAVLMNGEKAMRHGFTVSVKEIPLTKKQIEANEKEDPDSYCKTMELFQGIKETDFILWMADKKYEKDWTTEQQKAYIENIASLLADMEDEMAVAMYIRELSKISGTQQLWKKAVAKFKKENSGKEEKEKVDNESEHFKMFGFYVSDHNYYYSFSDKGGEEVWSNFTMRPLFHIKDSINPKRIFILKNIFGHEDMIEMRQEDLVSLSKFKQRVEGLGNFIWKASVRELTKLKGFLYEKTETAILISQLGWQRQGFFAFGNGIFYDGNFMKVDDYGIVRIEGKGNFYLPAFSKIYRDDIKLFQFERQFVHLGLSSVSLRQYTDQIFLVHKNNGRVGFMFLLATLFRDIVTRTTRNFPILNMFGPISSGKSELGHALTAFFIIGNNPPSIFNSTLPSMTEAVAAVSNALVHIDEYKNNMETNKNEFLKGLWDGTGRTRKNMELDKKKETTSVDAGIILSGQEMPTADIALFSRVIFLTFNGSSYSDEQKNNFLEMKRLRLMGASHLTLQLLKLRGHVEKDFPSFYQQTLSEMSSKFEKMVIEDRILMNWVAPLAVFRILETYIDTSLSYKQMFNICVDGIKFQSAQCKQNNELAMFWSMVQFLVSEGEIIEGGDFRIEYVHHLKTDLCNELYDVAHPILFMQKTRLFMLYKKYGKAVGDTLLPEGSLKYYLENSREYKGEKHGIRYTVYHRGQVQLQKVGELTKEASTVQRSYCFDYRKLVKLYNINFEKASDKDGDAVHIEDDMDNPTPERSNENPKQQELPL